MPATKKVLVTKKVEGVVSRQTTVKEVSLMLGGESDGWGGKKIRRLIRQGKISATKDIGRWFFNKDQLAAVIALAQGKVTE